jgi:hypothetical protein
MLSSGFPSASLNQSGRHFLDVRPTRAASGDKSISLPHTHGPRSFDPYDHASIVTDVNASAKRQRAVRRGHRRAIQILTVGCLTPRMTVSFAINAGYLTMRNLNAGKQQAAEISKILR